MNVLHSTPLDARVCLVIAGETTALEHAGPALAAGGLGGPFSKQHHSSLGLALVGSGTQHLAQCDCAAARSLSSASRHLAMNRSGVIPCSRPTRV